MKKCPYCSEKIQDAAIVCRYCHRELPKTETIEKNTSSKNKKILRLGLILLGAIILIVGGFILAKKLVNPKHINEPTTVSEPGMQIVYSEDFTDSSKLTDWEAKIIDDKSQVEVNKGAYHLAVEESYVASILRAKTFTNAVINIDLKFLGPDSANAIAICRNDKKMYIFSVSSNGHWKIDSSDRKIMSGDTDKLQPEKNKLMVSCVGETLALSLNGVELGSVQDSELTSGQIGLALESEGKAEVAFDNLTVSAMVDQKDAQPTTGDKGMSIATETPTPANTLTPQVTSTPIPAPTIVPTPRPTRIPEDKRVIYQTGFDDKDFNQADWNSFAYSMVSDKVMTDGFTVGASNGIYRLKPSEINQRIFSIYQPDLGTSDVDISIKRATVNDSGYIGLVCRYSKAGWYQFMEEPKGLWSIRMAKLGDGGRYYFYTLSSGYSYTKNLRAECKGNTLTIYTDDIEQASLHDDTFPEGKVGVLGWSYITANQTGMINSFTANHAEWNNSNLTGLAPTPDADGTLFITDFKNLNDLSPFWEENDLGVLGLPGDPTLIGPGSTFALHTYQYINDFDPGTGIKISADLNGFSKEARGLICRYSDDGWYQLHYWKFPAVSLFKMQRDKQGLWTETFLGSYNMPKATTSFNLSLSCVGNRISAAMDDKTVIAVEDGTFTSGKYGLMFQGNPPGNVWQFFKNYTARVAEASPADVVSIIDSQKFLKLLRLDWSYPGDVVKVSPENDGLLINNGQEISFFTISNYKDSETKIYLDFLADSEVNFRCLQSTDEKIEVLFDISSNGNWKIISNENSLASGTSAQITPTGNQFTFACQNKTLTLSANGSILATLPYPQEIETNAKSNRLQFLKGSQVRIKNISIIPSVHPVESPQEYSLLNRVVLPPAFAPGDTIFSFQSADLRADMWCPYHHNDRWYGPCLTVKDPLENIIVPSGKGILYWYDKQYQNNLPTEMTVDTTFTGKTGAIGLMCRLTGLGRYEFVIQKDGSWSIRRNTSEWYAPSAAKITILAHGTSSIIKPDNNQITAICENDELIFTANGTELGQVKDDLYPEGYFGFFFDAYTAGSFTNLNVKVPN